MRWMTTEPELEDGRKVWFSARKMSADELSAYANLHRLTCQREAFRTKNLPLLAAHYERSVFYQLNLDDVAHEYAEEDLPLPDALPEMADGLTRISDAMFRARVAGLKGEDGRKYEEQAFGLMRKMLTARPVRPGSLPACRFMQTRSCGGAVRCVSTWPEDGRTRRPTA